MAVTPLSIVNQAIAHIGGGDTPQIASFTDGSAAAIAASALYSPAVQFTLRQIRPTFANRYAVLISSGNVPPFGWSQEYLYPEDCLSFLDISPQTRNLDPRPYVKRVGTAAVGGVQTNVIWTNLAGAVGLYTSGIVNGVLPSDTSVQFDAIFQETLVRNLAASLDEALAGRADTARQKLGETFELAQIADMRADA